MVTQQTPVRRQLITGGDPNEPFPVPDEDRFVNDDGEEAAFIDAPDLRRIARHLIDHKLKFIENLEITYLWRAAGGKHQGRAVFGKCVRPTGLADFALECDLVILVAADHARTYRFTAYQMEALLYHELLHAGVSEKGGAILHGHDLEVFRLEIEEYGLWHPDLESAKRIIQPQLWDAGRGPGERDG